jgi:hypothetical protein
VGCDHAVAGGIGHAGQHITSFNLVVIKEALIALINGACDQLAGTGGAGTSAAGIWQIESRLLSSIKDVSVVGYINSFVETLALVDEGDLVGSYGRSWGSQATGEPDLQDPPFIHPQRPVTDGLSDQVGEGQSKAGHRLVCLMQHQQRPAPLLGAELGPPARRCQGLLQVRSLIHKGAE